MDTPIDESMLETSEHDRSAFAYLYRRYAADVLGYFVNARWIHTRQPI